MKNTSVRVVSKLNVEDIKTLKLDGDKFSVLVKEGWRKFKFGCECEAFNEFESVLDAIRKDAKYAIFSTIIKK